MKKRYVIGGIVAAGLLFGACGEVEEPVQEVTKTEESAPVEQPKEETPKKEEPKPEEKSEPKEEQPAPEPELSLSQQNAIGQAESYLSFTAFSKQGLIEQLEYEGYSTSDATFAVDNISVDWNEQAVLKAKSYLEFSSFSRTGLIDQLKYEGFSTQQATHAVDQIGL